MAKKKQCAVCGKKLRGIDSARVRKGDEIITVCINSSCQRQFLRRS